MTTPHEPDKNFLKNATSNTKDMVAYILMIIGIVLLFTNSFWGGLIVGFIFGIYFLRDIIALSRDLNDIIERQGIVRSLIFGGLALAFFISQPAIFIGAALAVALRVVVYPDTPGHNT